MKKLFLYLGILLVALVVTTIFYFEIRFFVTGRIFELANRSLWLAGAGVLFLWILRNLEGWPRPVGSALMLMAIAQAYLAGYMGQAPYADAGLPEGPVSFQLRIASESMSPDELQDPANSLLVLDQGAVSRAGSFIDGNQTAVLAIVFKEDAQASLKNIVKENAGKDAVIFIDDRYVLARKVSDGLAGGEIGISSGLTVPQTRNISNRINGTDDIVNVSRASGYISGLLIFLLGAVIFRGLVGSEAAKNRVAEVFVAVGVLQVLLGFPTIGLSVAERNWETSGLLLSIAYVLLGIAFLYYGYRIMSSWKTQAAYSAAAVCCLLGISWVLGL